MSDSDNSIYFIVEESPEGGFSARALGHAIFTDGDTLDEIRVNVRDAVACHFDEPDQPKFIHIRFVKEEVIAL